MKTCAGGGTQLSAEIWDLGKPILAHDKGICGLISEEMIMRATNRRDDCARANLKVDMENIPVQGVA